MNENISRMQRLGWGTDLSFFYIADVDFDALMTGNSRPISADRDWPLYGDEYYRMKFGNMPSAVIHLTSNSVLCATGTYLKLVI
jgi:hypothetical protein